MINSLLVLDAEQEHSTTGAIESVDETELCIFQLAWILYDIRGVEINRGDYFIKPYENENYQYNSFNGINKRSISEYGYYDDYVFDQFSTILKDYKPAIVAHNLYSIQRLLSNHLNKLEYKIQWNEFKTVCTRDLSARIFNLPQGQSFTLSELYEKLFNVPLKDANDAMVDAEATSECFLKLLQKFNTNNVTQTVEPVARNIANKKINLTDFYFNGNTRPYPNLKPDTNSTPGVNPEQTPAKQKSEIPWVSILLIIIGLINIIINPDSGFVLVLGLLVIALGLLTFNKK